MLKPVVNNFMHFFQLFNFELLIFFDTHFYVLNYLRICLEDILRLLNYFFVCNHQLIVNNLDETFIGTEVLDRFVHREVVLCHFYLVLFESCTDFRNVEIFGSKRFVGFEVIFQNSSILSIILLLIIPRGIDTQNVFLGELRRNI